MNNNLKKGLWTIACLVVLACGFICVGLSENGQGETAAPFAWVFMIGIYVVWFTGIYLATHDY